MADPSHLEIVRRGANATWNSDAPRLDLSNADLSGLNLRGARLHNSMLAGARLVATDLRNAQMQESNLSGAILIHANLDDAKLGGTNLSHSLLCSASLNRSTLVRACLNHANLTMAQFDRARLDHASFVGAILNRTSFVDSRLSSVRGLDQVVHEGPSELGMHNLLRAGLELPVEFLRGLGLPENFIDYIPALIQSEKSFGCYHIELIADSADRELAQRITRDLNSAGIRSWLRLLQSSSQETDLALQVFERRIILISGQSLQNPRIQHELTRYSSTSNMLIVSADDSSHSSTLKHVSFDNWLSLNHYRDSLKTLIDLCTAS